MVPCLLFLSKTIELLGGVRTEGIFRRPGHAGAKVALMKAISAGDYSVLHRYPDDSCAEPVLHSTGSLKSKKLLWVQAGWNSSTGTTTRYQRGSQEVGPHVV